MVTVDGFGGWRQLVVRKEGMCGDKRHEKVRECVFCGLMRRELSLLV